MHTNVKTFRAVVHSILKYVQLLQSNILLSYDAHINNNIYLYCVQDVAAKVIFVHIFPNDFAI